MKLDIFTDFLVNNTRIQNIIVLSLVSGFMIALFFYMGIKKPEVIILSICLVFIYLYYLNLITTAIFGGVLLVLFVALYFILKFY